MGSPPVAGLLGGEINRHHGIIDFGTPCALFETVAIDWGHLGPAPPVELDMTELKGAKK